VSAERVRAVTIRDVAREAEVSVASASRALNGLDNVTDATRQRVLAAAQQLRYVPDIGARMLSTRRSDTIGVVLPDLYGEFFSELIRGMDTGTRAKGLHLLVSNSHGDADEAAAAIRSMRGRVDGLLLMSPHVDAHLLADNLAHDLPIVLINTRVDGDAHPAFRVDNHAGAMTATRHLMARGRRRVAHIAGPADNFEAQERRRGYEDALEGAEPIVLAGDFSEQSGADAGAAILAMDPRPDAVFAANDMMAVGCLGAFEAAGLTVPGDIALAGFDDIPIARLLRPSLTTVRIGIADLGLQALQRLVSTLEQGGPAQGAAEVIEPELIVRDSS
jgi:LacI family transcriptional regulator, galactose operon repressor